MHIYHIYATYFPVLYQPVVGTLGKFPNRHLFQSNFYSSVGKLWATIEISISAQLSIKSIFSNIIGIGYWQNFTFGPILYSNLHLMYCQMGNFHYFPHCLAHWLSKPWYFMKFHLLPHFVQQFTFYVLSNGKFLLFLFLFDMLAIKVMAFCEISLSSHQNLPFFKHVKVVK